MIRSFASKETESLFATGKARRLPPDILRRAVMRLRPSNQLESLAGDRQGQWSIRINAQWRLCFRFERGDAFKVEIVDYH